MRGKKKEIILEDFLLLSRNSLSLQQYISVDSHCFLIFIFAITLFRIWKRFSRTHWKGNSFWVTKNNTGSLLNQNQPLFVCSALHTVGYYSHVRDFQVRENETKIIMCVAADNLYEPRPLSVYKMTSGEKIRIPRYCHYG